MLVKPFDRSNRRVLRPSLLVGCTLGTAVISTNAAHAAEQFIPYASAAFENDSNLFATPPQNAAVDPQGMRRLSDAFETYKGGFDFGYLFDRQRLYATVEGRRIEYDHFTGLDHSEYLLNLGIAWRLTSRFDGLFDARREKKIIAFADENSETLQIQTDQVVKGTFNVAVTPVWRLETLASLHTLDYPIAESPDFRLQEGQEGIGLKYVGIADLSYGLQGTHLEGNYSGQVNAANYRQNTGEFALNYTLKQVTRLSATLGYTDRQIDGSSISVSGVTGSVGYDRQLTGKTDVSFKFQREVNSYVTAGSSEIDTGGTAAVTWQATAKIGVSASYEREHSEFEGETLQNSLTLGRKDNASSASLEVRYQPLRWLLVRPYVKRQVRTSSDVLFTYNDTAVGIELLARPDWQKLLPK